MKNEGRPRKARDGFDATADQGMGDPALPRKRGVVLKKL